MILHSGERSYFNDIGWDLRMFQIVEIKGNMYEFTWNDYDGLQIYALQDTCPWLAWSPGHTCGNDGDCSGDIAYQDNTIWYRNDVTIAKPGMTFQEWMTTPRENLL